MTQERVIELAGHREVPPWVMKLVMDAVAEEREACANVCDDHFSSDGHWCAAAIRARTTSDGRL